MLARIWGSEHYSAAMGDGGLKRLAGFMQFIEVKADCEVIAQDERGDYLLIILDGTVAVDRVQPWGGRVRLGESRPGDILGEMSLLDAGTRFSACRTLTPCTLGVLEASEMDRMMNDDPRLAAALMAALARRLSLRLRQASARLSALLAQG
jgi:CRP-like cAMP-binding protein